MSSEITEKPKDGPTTEGIVSPSHNNEVDSKGSEGHDDKNSASGLAKGDDGDDLRQDDTYFPDPDINTPTLLESISWWAEFSSIHGVYYAFERGHFRAWKQIIWSTVTLATTGLLIWVLVLEFQEYFKYHLNSTSKTIGPRSLSFPQVTVCNHNKYDSSLQNSTGIYEPSNEKELVAISQPFEEFIKKTAFNERLYENLTEAWDPVITPFGLCYNFVTEDKVFKPGVTAGLNVWLWLNQSNYDESTFTAGVDVFVTQPGTIITDQAAPVSIPPGASSSISLSLMRFQRERGDPLERCKGSAPAYTNEVCRADCINLATREICGCRQIGDSDDSGMRYCNSTDTECSSNVDDEALAECDCSTPPCEEDVYITRYSAASIAVKAASRIERDENLSGEFGRFSLNFVAVNINFDSIRYEELSESRATDAPSLVSNMGGNMGFFMGISMISILEIFVELLGLRVIPRLWGDKRLYGIGQKKTD